MKRFEIFDIIISICTYLNYQRPTRNRPENSKNGQNITTLSLIINLLLTDIPICDSKETVPAERPRRRGCRVSSATGVVQPD